ncbi:MAG: hypothetical protein ACK4MQ_03195 [Hyphomonas sp.]
MHPAHLITSRLLAALAIAATIPQHAQAEPESATPGWSVQLYGTYNTDYLEKVGKGDYVLKQGASEDKASFTGIVAFTNTPNAPSVLLDCTDKARFGITFSLKPVDFSDKAVLFGQDGRLRGQYGEVLIAGERYERRQRFIFRKKGSIAYGVGREFAYRIVDAIYAGDPVTLKLIGQPEVTYHLPKPDQALAAFISNCPAFSRD